ncbi:Stk1 family PASTA domain-containing Ser/Thr kinase [Clostridium sp.]|jgi:serine/threonine-protein kinase|uniref:Stk1 family PASTA domain-containing Ser/Thr kinase n=1 Tax=Clostridium sp. TaxID=1506 RepID=UPI00258DBC9C|nr:Stk1 family PASTA domain-containing Ser/Thr kinase [Clostridium sp.]MDF2502745.1 serine/threonine protein kinase [Clostridium sp.]
MLGITLNNRYELLEKIGEGGTAIVYKAKCHLLNRFVAVKVLKDELSTDKDFVEKFKREASAAASLSNNNIVNIYDVGTEGNINYIVQEYIKGKTLKEVITEEGKLNWKKAINISRQIASALDCAHKNNIVHRDIKPHNILVTEDGIVKVADFGIAKASDSVTITNSNKIMGSAHYLSPEQAKGIVVDGRTDIYSLGIVIYEMLTGKVPYDAESPVSVALKHIQDPVVPPAEVNPNIPSSLNKLVLKCMEKNPVSRYQNAKELIQDLDKISNNSTMDFANQVLKDDYTMVMDPINDTAQFTPLGNVGNVNDKKLINDEDKYDNNSKEDEESEEENLSQDKKISSPSKKKKGIIISTLIAVVVIAVIAIGYSIGAARASLSQNAKTEKVPNVIGMKQDDAKKLIEGQGFKYTVAGTEKNDKPKGTVLECFPNAGEAIAKGGSIRVTISSGPDQSVVPDLMGLDLNKAKEVIENAGYTLGDVSKEYSDNYPYNTVINVNPDVGSTLDKGSAISIVISRGPRIKQSTVTPVIGLSQDAAVKALSNIGLSANVVTRITNDSNQNNIVADQDPAAGTKLNQGATVTITVYKYSQPAASTNVPAQNTSAKAQNNNGTSDNKTVDKNNSGNNVSSNQGNDGNESNKSDDSNKNNDSDDSNKINKSNDSNDNSNKSNSNNQQPSNQTKK